MNEKIKVFFIIPTLYGGGAERVVSYIPQFINKQKFDVELIIIGFEKDSTYPVSGIPVRFLNKKRVLDSIFEIIKIFSKEKPKIVFSTLSHLNVAMGFISLLFPKIKFIGRHTIVNQNPIALSNKKESFSKRAIQKIYRTGTNLLDIVLCQSKDMYDDMDNNYYKVPKIKRRVIHNPLRNNFELKPHTHDSEGVKHFITVARLVPMKGHERILRAIAKLNYPFIYTIVGDGKERENIFNIIEELGISDNITHIPYTNEVSKYLSESDFYLMGSYAEGFPNCLIESCSVGTPVIAFNAPGGLNEIIENGVNGFLVNNEKEFIEKLNYVQKWNPEKVRESVYKKFNLKKIIDDYENLFIEVLD
ncbi:glycosyltransferase [Winogradskyella sp. HB-48]|uniref:glycosyltransferase n=1 Tax=Winogradskyella sp. HB-48 TaxID=3416808 RepID=UPI003CF2F318